MAHIKLLSLLLSMFLAIVNAFQVLQPTHVAEVDLRAAYPEPTPRTLMGEENPNIIGRSYYNTLCGYADGNLNYPVSCVDGYICATASHYYGAGCCNPSELDYCTIPSTCIPYGDSCNAACQAENIAYTSCGYLTPYCFTKVFEYGSPYYEYDCATASGIITILTTASGQTTENVATSIAVVTQTIATTAVATAVDDNGTTGTSITNISCGSGSECGNGQGANGNGNGVGNNAKSETTVRTAAPGLRLYAFICAAIFASF